MARKKPKIGRKLPVTKPEMTHKTPMDYDRRDNEHIIEKELEEMDTHKDYIHSAPRKEEAQKAQDRLTVWQQLEVG